MHRDECVETSVHGVGRQQRDLKSLALLAALAVSAQQLLARPAYPWAGPTVYAAAIGLFLWGMGQRHEADLLFPFPNVPSLRR